MWRRIVSFSLVVFTCNGLDQDICTDTCTEPVIIEASVSDTLVTACDGDMMMFTMDNIDKENDRCSLSLLNAKEESFDHIFFYKKENKLPERTYSVYSSVTVRLSPVTDLKDCTFKLAVSCMKSKSSEISQSYGEGSEELTLLPNARDTFSFNGVNLHHISVNSTLSSPTAGFNVLSLNDGDYYMQFGSIESAALKTRSASSRLDMLTFTEQAYVSVSWELGENTTPPPTTTTTTTTTTKPRLPLDLFVLGVNEEQFVRENSENLRDFIWNLINTDLTNNVSNPVQFASVISCRNSCGMTDNIDRGCVKFDVDVTGVPLKQDFISDQLTSKLDDLGERFSASQVYLDSCNEVDITNSWLLIPIFTLIGCAIICVGILLLTGKTRRERKLEEDNYMGHTASNNLRNDQWEIVDYEKEKYY